MYSRCSHLGPLAAKLRPWSRVHGLLARRLCAKPRVSLFDIPFPSISTSSLFFFSHPSSHLLSRQTRFSFLTQYGFYIPSSSFEIRFTRVNRSSKIREFLSSHQVKLSSLFPKSLDPRLATVERRFE